MASQDLKLPHNPMTCQGDGNGQNCSDDPCWICVTWAFLKLQELGVTAQT